MPEQEWAAVRTRRHDRHRPQISQERALLLLGQRLSTPDCGPAGERDADHIQPVIAIRRRAFDQFSGDGACVMRHTGQVWCRPHQKDTATERLAIQPQRAQLIEPWLKLARLKRRQFHQNRLQEHLR